MLNALNAAATGMQAQSKQVEVISNNIANADTTSFKKSRADFQDLLYQNDVTPGAATSATTSNPTGVQIGGGVKLVGTAREFTQGSLRGTDRELDVAIEGDGFLAFQKPNGDVAFSRDGALRVSNEGRIENAQGLPLVPEMTIPQGTQSLNISMDGRVQAKIAGSNELQELGQIQLSTFANPSGLQAEGGNLYVVSNASGVAAPSTPGDVGVGRIHQKFLEASNVSAVTEMTDLIRAQRMYELNSKVITSTDQMMQTINQIK